MLYTNNYKLKKPEQNDNYDIGNENYNMNIIDNGIAPFYVATLNSANTYKITTGLSLTELQDGFSVRIAIPSASTGASSLIIDEVGAIPIKKVNGNAVTNLKANGVYSLTYYNKVFILASGSVDSDKVTASEADVILNKTYIGSDEDVHTGNMPNNGALNASIGVNGTFNIPEGYTSGGKVTQSIPTQGATTYTPSISDQIIYSGRYLSGNQTIKGDTNLIASNIVSGKSIFNVSGTATIESLGGKKVDTRTVTIDSKSSITYDVSFPIKYVFLASRYYSAHGFFDVNNVYGSSNGSSNIYDGNVGQGSMSVNGSSVTITNSTSTRWYDIPVFCLGE